MKNILIVVVVLALLGVGGVFVMNSRQSKSTDSMTQTTPKPKDSNVFASIKDALSKSATLQCNYKDEKGIETTTYIKAGSLRVNSTSTTDAKTQMTNIIMKDSKMYMWDDKTKEGIVYTIDTKAMAAKVTAMPKTTATPQSDEDKKDSMIAQIEKYKDSCKPAVVADSLFTPPSDVKFQDMSEMMKGIMQTTPGAAQNGGMNSQDYQNYLKQMMQQGATP